MIHTVGHSNHPIERFLALLQPHGITAVADVRSTPYSRFNPQFRRGIERLKAGMAEHQISIMCAEREPLECHRTILVARELVREGIGVTHILGDGSLEPHDRAYDLHANRIAFVKKGA